MSHSTPVSSCVRPPHDPLSLDGLGETGVRSSSFRALQIMPGLEHGRPDPLTPGSARGPLVGREVGQHRGDEHAEETQANRGDSHRPKLFACFYVSC